MIQAVTIQGRSLRLIAADIEEAWNGQPPPDALLRAAFIAMQGVASIQDWYGPIPMVSIVRSVVAIADEMPGQVPAPIVAELRAMLGD